MKKLLALFVGAVMVFGVGASVACSRGGAASVNVPLEYYEYNAPAEGEEEREYNHETVYQNDLETLGADPSVIYVTEGDQAGYYYMYLTSDQIGASGYQCFRSKNLNDWECMGVAYNPTLYYDQEADITYSSFATSSFWAPEVIYDEDLGLYMLFYNAAYLFKGLNFYMDCAVSEDPQGPFVQYAEYIMTVDIPADATAEEREVEEFWRKELEPYADNEAADAAGLEDNKLYVYPALLDFTYMRDQKEGETDSDYLEKEPNGGYMKVIDASPFIDPVSGTKYLYFTRDLNGGNGHNDSAIGVIEMDDQWRPALEKDADGNFYYKNVRLLTECNRKNVGVGVANAALNEGRVNEAPFMVYNEENGKYYLMYSANSYWDKTYSVRVAVGDSPDGKFTKLTRAEGGWLLYADPSCSWMSGTGHHSVVTANGKSFIVYHAHTDRVTGNSSRAIGFDEFLWTTNNDDLLVPYVNGGSYAYMPQTAGEWSNIATEATVSSNNVLEGSSVNYLNDGIVKFHDDGFVYDYEMNLGATEITLTFEDYREVRGLFIFNAYNYDQTVSRISSVEFTFKDEEANVEGTAYTGTLDFYWDKYYNYGEYIPGGSFAIEFAPLMVKEIKITIPSAGQPLALSEIMVLGK